MSNNQPTTLTMPGGLRPGSTDRPTGVAEVGTGPDLHRGSSLSQASRRPPGSQPRHALEWHATHSFSHLTLQQEPHENAAVWPDPCLWACNLKSKRPPREGLVAFSSCTRGQGWPDSFARAIRGRKPNRMRDTKLQLSMGELRGCFPAKWCRP